MLQRIRIMAAAVLVLAVSPLACSFREPIRGQETTGLDRKLSTFAFIEEGDLVAFILDTRATRYREKSEYMPLEICIANKGLRQLTLTRESFTLRDSSGNRYPAATPKELIETYEFLDIDRNGLAELNGIVFNKFAAYARYPSRFSPTDGVSLAQSSIVRDRVSLPKFGYLLDFIYFPVPESGLKGQQLELFMEAPELPDPVFIRFEVK